MPHRLEFAEEAVVQRLGREAQKAQVASERLRLGGHGADGGAGGQVRGKEGRAPPALPPAGRPSPQVRARGFAVFVRASRFQMTTVAPPAFSFTNVSTEGSCEISAAAPQESGHRSELRDSQAAP